MTEHIIVNDDDWLTARKELLAKEKEFSKILVNEIKSKIKNYELNTILSTEN